MPRSISRNTADSRYFCETWIQLRSAILGIMRFLGGYSKKDLMGCFVAQCFSRTVVQLVHHRPGILDSELVDC